MNVRYKTLLRAKMSNNQELWTEYRSLRNRVTHEVRVAKSRFYVDLFDEVKDCKSYWKLVKKSCLRVSVTANTRFKDIRRVNGNI